MAGYRPAPNIIEKLPLIDAIKKIFKHGSLPPSPHYVFDQGIGDKKAMKIRGDI
jgi:hypothetical protein